MTKAPGRPALRYHGGKWRIAPWIISRFPDHRIYVEPYGGAASILLRKPRAYAEIYNDLDGEIVNYFRVLRDHPRQLQRALALTPFARDEYRLAFQMSEDPIEQARRTCIRSYMGFGSNSISKKVKSGFRANSTHRTGPTHADDWAAFPRSVKTLSRRLSGVVIEHGLAIPIIKKHDSKRTLHYLDPTYVHATRSKPRDHGYVHEMTDDDHRELAACLMSVKGMVVLSGYHSRLYDELYGDWYREERITRADGARPRKEVLWFNHAAHAALIAKFMQGGLFEGSAA